MLNPDDAQLLQTDINNVVDWFNTNLLSINVPKCKIVSFGRNVDKSQIYYINGIQIEREEIIKDLGVYFDSRLTFDAHINDKINKAYSILGIIKRNFNSLSHEAFLSMYKALVRSHLEYAVQVWNPYKKEYIEKLERVQLRVSKLQSDIKSLPYRERLIRLGLPTLKYRRIRGDIIELYKIIKEHYDSDTVVKITYAPYASTRGNNFKLFSQHSTYELRKHCFINRVTNVWNSIPNYAINAPSLNVFKNRLDNFWSNQDIIYDWKADLTGTGSRSFE